MYCLVIVLDHTKVIMLSKNIWAFFKTYEHCCIMNIVFCSAIAVHSFVIIINSTEPQTENPWWVFFSCCFQQYWFRHATWPCAALLSEDAIHSCRKVSWQWDVELLMFFLICLPLFMLSLLSIIYCVYCSFVCKSVSVLLLSVFLLGGQAMHVGVFICVLVTYVCMCAHTCS